MPIESERPRLHALIQYVQQSARMRTKVVYNVAEHGRFLLMEHQLAGLAGVTVNDTGADEDDELWLSVPRPPNPELPPEAHSAWLSPWLAVGGALLEAPKLATAVDGWALIGAGTHREATQGPVDAAELAKPGIESGQRVALSDYEFKAAVDQQFAHYLEETWKPWAEAERRRRRWSRLYVQLFTLQQELAGAMVDGQFELVWGVGLGTWKDKTDNPAVSYPLLSRLVDLTFNQQTGAAEIRPRDVDAKLELEVYASLDNPGIAEAERRAKELFAAANSTLSPFDPGSYEPLLATIKACLEYQSDEPMPGDLSIAKADERLQITSTWVLFARPRSGNVLIQDLDKFTRALEGWPEDRALPQAVAALVTEPAAESVPLELPAFRGVSAVYQEARPGPGAPERDLFFPKPFNDEQLRIAQWLESSDGVVVQGPPGTGKSHTIANIICHWLASGRRVLVSSMKDPALAVLREQLPAEIRPLAISLLASEQEGMKQFERSIHKIASEVQSIDLVAATREIEQLEGTIEALHARLARIDTDAGRWAKLNLARIELDAEVIDPVDAAQEVLAHTGQFEWIPDALGVGPQYAPRFNDADIRALREASKKLGPDLHYAGRELPAFGELPDTQLLLQAHQDLARFARLCAENRSENTPQPVDASPETLTALRSMHADIERIQALRQDVARMNVQWSAQMGQRLRGGAVSDQLYMLEALGRELDQAAARRKAYLARPVSVPESAELDATFAQAVDNLAEGRRAFGLAGVFGKTAAKQSLERTLVNGRPPTAPADWQHVADFLVLQRKWRELAARWNALVPDLGLEPVLAEEPTQAMAAAAQFARYRRLKTLVTAETALAQQAMRLFPRWPSARLVAEDPASFRELEKTVVDHVSLDRLREVTAIRERMHKLLEGRSGPVVGDIRTFIGEVLGDPRADEPAVLARWSTLMAELSRVHGLGASMAAVREITGRVADSGAPRYAQSILQAGSDEADKLLPETWARDWRLRRLASHLAAIDSQEEFKKLAKMRGDLEHDLARAYHGLVVGRTWLALAQQATPEVRAALQAYLNAIQKIGKGTGKRAVRYRQDARNAAANAISAIPCWIMPHHRVSETLPAQLGCFDLVVIDEASQSDLSALPVLLRARKLLIVGDDKQVSPEGAGLDEQKIKALMQRFLSDQVPVYRAQMSPERSIYDLAKVVFARSGVMLREHFRCVAPIIEYSKREFYNHELRPLRLPKPSERLDPPLVDVFIADGERSGDVNHAEIDFIVEEIRALTSDPDMRQRSIGVVSLLGEEQAVRIWDRLNDELGPQLLQHHRVACGDARTFQGRERDVVFLSLVCAPNDVGAPLARETFAQRFNVGASRARDRMYLVRSVQLDHLSEADRFRRSLIAHFAQPFPRAEERSANPRDACESPFERDLYDWLAQEGYRVSPQVQVGGYRIDLVVEGAKDTRLAIECDGDRYQAPEKWADDMRRERVLARAGWVFWRCFAATFVRRREAVLRDLRATLAAHGIDPLAAGEDPSLNVRTQTRRTRGVASVEVRAMAIPPAGLPQQTGLALRYSVQRISSRSSDRQDSLDFD